MQNTKTILIAPLDWGLGHATRCMPIIDVLLKNKHRVLIAGNGDSFLLLKETYPSCTFYELPAYNIQYSNGKNAALQSLLQTPKIMRAIEQENSTLQQITTIEKIDLIISDNRYGIRHPDIKSIIICHQIALQSPSPFGFMNPVFLKLHLQQIHKFNALWIPDNENEPTLSGKLSHDISFKIPHRYIGILSRFSNYSKQVSFVDELDFDVLIVLSGVEPQRTTLEQELIHQFKKRKEKVLLIQGKTEVFSQSIEDNCTIISYLNTNDLFSAIQKSKILIARSGYSTVMDLAVLDKQAIFIPAAGQTEQEYLAKTLSEKGFAVACHPQKININEAILHLKKCNGFKNYTTNSMVLESIILQSFL
ncbi:MAG TPA: glycosyltransferase [Chitinophagales bacterium]|nr:hypothetical protein [Chitinophagales bacterium]MBP6153560.1 hypothetical protein [Chitinophagales bacterium]HQV76962.1 glycosyltransferase [Chitinophagales bacterium]HQW77971.1 glycosyltransferase [Chitinophagales bacterium]HRB19990.1 glycosyltransferase [Chitinophagales bacterium]